MRFIIRRIDTREYESNADVDPITASNWSLRIDDAYVWYVRELADDQSKDYALLGLATEVISI